MNAELFKIRKHRMPWILTGLVTLAGLLPSGYWLFTRSDVVEALAVADVLQLSWALVAAVFGGWVLGHEYRQHTLRRSISVDARRDVLLVRKAVTGLAVMSVMLATSFAVSVGGVYLVGALNNATTVGDELVRNLAATGFVALASYLVAFAVSAITRSDTYAMLTSLGVLVVFQPLLALVPRIGKFMPGSVTGQVAGWISSAEVDFGGVGLDSNMTAALVAAAWIGGTALVGRQLFVSRDI